MKSPGLIIHVRVGHTYPHLFLTHYLVGCFHSSSHDVECVRFVAKLPRWRFACHLKAYFLPKKEPLLVLFNNSYWQGLRALV